MTEASEPHIPEGGVPPGSVRPRSRRGAQRALHQWVDRALEHLTAPSGGFGVGLVLLGLAGAWSLTARTGGTPNALVQTFYVPIVFAASRFRWRGAVATAVAAGALTGPLMPSRVASATQISDEWIRLVAFVAIGVLVAWLTAKSSQSIGSTIRDAHGARYLRSCLDEHAFVAFYQPVVDLTTGEVVGFEALCRLQDPARGTVAPAEFIPLAERTGVVVALDSFMLTQATRQGAAWLARGSADFSIAVNLSADRLCQPGLAALVAAALEESGLPAKHLCLEITESAIIADPPVALANAKALQELGVQIALDDFGTGQSTMTYVRDFPIDIFKIDQSFVGCMDSDRKSAALVASIVHMARILGARTIAEGVQRRSQYDALRAMGCDYAQGYYLGRPAEAALADYPSTALPPVR